MIERREQAAGKQYKFVMNLRGDLVYRASLPAFAEWPPPSPPRLGPVLFVQECIGGVLQSGRCNPLFQGHLGCVSDQWGVMARSVADLWYQRDWEFYHHNATAQNLTGYECSMIHVFECLRGCVMHYNNVWVTMVKKKPEVLHNVQPDGEVPVCGELSLKLSGAREKSGGLPLPVPVRLTDDPEEYLRPSKRRSAGCDDA
mmetsp:Transcript_94771/g.251698  ORF Transcript_94771/g.251698 Transcript_94771/m.251698 type:complete len:200 (-) Transcript_94771:357-956(-)